MRKGKHDASFTSFSPRREIWKESRTHNPPGRVVVTLVFFFLRYSVKTVAVFGVLFKAGRAKWHIINLKNTMSTFGTKRLPYSRALSGFPPSKWNMTGFFALAQFQLDPLRPSLDLKTTVTSGKAWRGEVFHRILHSILMIHGVKWYKSETGYEALMSWSNTIIFWWRGSMRKKKNNRGLTLEVKGKILSFFFFFFFFLKHSRY